jgi:hypothetical protein
MWIKKSILAVTIATSFVVATSNCNLHELNSSKVLCRQKAKMLKPLITMRTQRTGLVFSTTLDRVFKGPNTVAS